MNKEQAINLIEKAMVTMAVKPKPGEVCQYLAGYIDALFESGQINETLRSELYFTYAESPNC
jgi:hypothetical protein